MTETPGCAHIESGPRHDEEGRPVLVFCKKCLDIKHDDECPCHGTTPQAIAFREALGKQEAGK